jgi:formyltetrahydrofolate hydrolase
MGLKLFVKKYMKEIFRKRNSSKSKIFIVVQNKGSLALKIDANLRKKCDIIISNNYKNLKKKFLFKKFKSITIIKSKNNKEFNQRLMIFLSQFKEKYILNLTEKIYNKKILFKMRNKIINFHPSFLPSHRGLNAFEKAYNGNLKSGSTAHFCNNLIDRGAIITQDSYKIDKFRSYSFNRHQVFKLQLKQIEKILFNIITNQNLSFKYQKD